MANPARASGRGLWLVVCALQVWTAHPFSTRVPRSASALHGPSAPVPSGWKRIGKEWWDRRSRLAFLGGVSRSARGVVMSVSASEMAETISEETQCVDGLDVKMKLERLGGTRRRISAGVEIAAPPNEIWDVLTNYDALQEFIPNIASSNAVVQPDGGLHLEQVGVVSRRLGLTTRIVLDVSEQPFEKLTFSKIEAAGFSEFQGTYKITKRQDGSSYVHYSIVVMPLPVVPVFLVLSKLRASIPEMLAAVRTRVYSRRLAAARG
jgi:hypothetical protein